TDTLTGTITGNTSLTINPAAANAIAVDSGDNQSATVNTNIATAPSVLVTDSYGNPVSGVSVSFAVATGGGSLTGGSTSTNASGIATVGSLKLGTTSGANTLTATSTGLTGSPLTFTATATPGTAATLSLSAPASATAGSSFSVTTTPQDAYGNTATGYTGPVHFSGGGTGSPTLPADYTF